MWSMISQAMWMPVNLMAYGWELLMRMAQGMEVPAGQQIDQAVSRLAYGLRSAAGCEPSSRGADRYGNDQDLSGEGLKLVQYVVLFVKRGCEAAFGEREEVVWDSLTPQEFTTWKIAQFVQQFPGEGLPEQWQAKDYPPKDGQGERVLPEEDKKYLRVYFRVLKRYPRQEFRFQERQVEVLGEIRDALEDQPKKKPPKPSRQDSKKPKAKQ